MALLTGERVLVVTPTYQEAGNIVRVLTAVRAALPEAAVLVVDDGSPDGTADLAEAAAADLGSIHVLRRTSKDGLGEAYRSGFRWGLDHGAEVLVEMDADLQHDPGALPSLVAPVLAGEADLVIGSRYVPGGSIPEWKWSRRSLSLWGNRYAATVLGLDVKDATAGFRAFRAETLEAIGALDSKAEGYGFQIELTHLVRRAGHRIVEIPIQFGEREVGESKMSAWITAEAFSYVTWWALRDRVLRRGRRP